MGDTYLENANTAINLLRSFTTALNTGAYGLLSLVYRLFFNVATVDLFSNETMLHFYGRIQLIIGVFMMFQLAVTIVRGIVEPDTFTDKKSGARNIITKVLISLILFTSLIPISIPSAKNEFEKQINNNGLLFGTLFSLQHRILSENTIGKLIFGTGAESSYYLDSDDSDDLKEVSNTFTTTVLRAFYRINLIPEEERKYDDGKDKLKDPALYADFRLCKSLGANDMSNSSEVEDSDKSDPVVIYFTTNDPSDILGMSKFTCASATKHGFLSKVTSSVADKFSGKNYYFLAVHGFFAFVVALIFIFIFLSFTIDVGVRAIKLAVLRLIAPIPIISYMDPRGGKDSAFNSWVKVLTSTYLDLFIRLAAVYFVLFIIQDIIKNGIVMNNNFGGLSTIIIFIALFIFAKQAPKFIKQVLGIKEDAGAKLFGGFGDVAAIGAAGLGVVGSTVSNVRARRMENDIAERELKEKLGDDYSPSRLRNMTNAGKTLVSGLAGGVGGAVVGAKALMSKDSSAKSVMTAQSQRNSNRLSHSTLPGRIASDLYGMGYGVTLADRDSAIGEAAGKAAKAFGDYKDNLKEQAKKNGRTGELNGMHFNYQALEGALERNTDSRTGLFWYEDDYGHRYEGLSAAYYSQDKVKEAILDSQTKNWMSGHDGTGKKPDGSDATDFAEIIKPGKKLYSVYQDAQYNAEQAGIDFDLTAAGYDDIGTKIGAANEKKVQHTTSLSAQRHLANKNKNSK